MNPDQRTIAAALAPFRTALLVTHGEDGQLRCRPMAMRQAVRTEEIWFATAPDSAKCREVEGDPRCALVFFDPGEGTTLTVSGTGEVLRDRKLMTELWDASWARWFPGGPDPRSVALLRVLPQLVERHDGPSGRVEILLDARRPRR